MNNTTNDLHLLAEANHGNIAQIEAVKNGVNYYSDCFGSFEKSDTLHVMSVTKSIVSLCVGIAIDNGLIESVNQRVLDFFPDYKVKRGEKTIQNITLYHLLTMTAPYKYRSEPWTKVCTSDDWTLAALDLLGGRSGITNEFKYSTLGIHILNGIITQKSGLTTTQFANRYLFEPLGIAPHCDYLAQTAEEHKAFIMSKLPKGDIWFADPKGVATAGYGLCLSACDMVKIGRLCLAGGKFENKRIVSEEWLYESFRPRYRCDENFANMSYGYLWWIIDEKKQIYAAIGDGGNVIYINMAKNITVAVTATFKPAVFDRVPFIMENIEPLLDSIE